MLWIGKMFGFLLYFIAGCRFYWPVDSRVLCCIFCLVCMSSLDD